MNRWYEGFKELKKYPSAVAGMMLIAFLVGLSFFAIIKIPYRQAVELWRGGEAWQEYPRNAAPVWTNLLRRHNLPSTIKLSREEATVETDSISGFRREKMILPFKFHYLQFPAEMNLFLETEFTEKTPHLKISWITPDNREISLGTHRPRRIQRLALSQNRDLTNRLGHPAHIGLLLAHDEQEQGLTVQQGEYQLVLETLHFEPESRLNADFIAYGKVHGLAGTDHQRRDLMVALLWGTPIALMFGLVAAVGTTMTTLIIATTGVWFGGWVDATIQRITEINMILPLLPVLVMVGTLFSRSLWLMLAVVVLLGLFSGGVKMYRSMLLPVREAPFIEAARAYGVGHRRIIMRYMIPRVLPVLIPSFVILIPTFVFLEASLAVLGLGDPVLPTWGKVLNDAQQQSALYNGFYYWVVTPAVMLMLTGLGFAMLGFALDRIFNPRLRSN